MIAYNEEQILDKAFRARVIKEISGTENIARKNEARRRYKVYKDRTKDIVIDRLRGEGLSKETVAAMANRASNISICKKIINKLARTYANGAVRSSDNEVTTLQISELAKIVKLDDVLRQSDRYRELYKNTMLWVKAEPVDEDFTKYFLKVQSLQPWQYDVIEDHRDREKPLAVILSDYMPGGASGGAASEHEAGFHGGGSAMSKEDDIDQVIADSPLDARQSKTITYIWWSKKYHFTTDKKGEIINVLSPEDLANPIDKLPFIVNAEGQDGQFYAEGGEDIVDGSILINLMLTDMFSIAYNQGYGQIVVTGLNLPDKFKVGPHNAILLEYDPAKDEPKPEVSVVSPNPPLDTWMQAIEQYVALLLSTNNLSPGNIANRLDASQFPSGIALIIEQSEAQNDVEDKQKEYRSIESSIWDILLAWHNLGVSTGELTDEFLEIGPISEDSFISIKFPDIKPVVTEAEKLDNISKRKDLGLNEEYELIMIDNPDMTVEDAQAKIERIKAEKQARMASFAPKIFNDKSSEEDEDDDDSGE